MIKVGIIGATGYAGAELVSILLSHPDVEITSLTSRQYEGKSFSDVYPVLRGRTDRVCETFDMERFCDNVDVAFIALPHKLPMEIVPGLLSNGKKVIDLSADFRFNSVALYESFYQPHTAKDLLEKSVYGLSEIYEEQIRNTSLVGNPGCYPTTVLLALIPLIKKGLVNLDGIIADSKSGVSGAGRSLSLTTHYCEANESFKPYKLDGHRHRPEMEENLSNEAGSSVSITFIPHLIPANRGMLSTIYATVPEGIAMNDVRSCYHSFYSDKPFVRIYDDTNQPPDIKYVQNTNFCDIGYKIDENSRRIVLISAIDNLIKGAAGQAVQNMNIMMGFNESNGFF